MYLLDLNLMNVYYCVVLMNVYLMNVYFMIVHLMNVYLLTRYYNVCVFDERVILISDEWHMWPTCTCTCLVDE